MPSTPSTRLRVELQPLGSNLATWGDPNLNEALKRLEEAISDVVPLTVTGNYTLTSQNFIADEARGAVLKLSGSPGATYKQTIPAVEKTYWVYNGTNADQTIGTSGGTAATVRTGRLTFLFCDGTDCFASDPTLDQIKAAAADVSLNSHKLTNVTDPTSAQDAATKHYVDTATADRSMGGHKITSLAAPSATDDAARKADVDAVTAAVAGSATAAASSATAAATSETNAASSAAAAASSATNAASSATAAASSATSSATSASNAAATLTNALVKSNNLSDVSNAATARGNILPSKTGNSLKVLRVNSGETDYELATISAIPSLDRVAKSAGYTAVAGDKATVLDFTTASVTLALTAAATLGAGWWCYVRNSAATGSVTIDPNSTELVDGASTATVRPGETVVLQCDGSAFRSISVSRQSRVLITTTVASAAASVDFTGLSSDYEFYEIEFHNVTRTGALWVRTSTDNGATFDAGASDYVYAVSGYTASVTGTSNTGDAQILCGLNIGATSGTSNGRLKISGHATSNNKVISGQIGAYTSTGPFATVAVWFGARLSSTVVNAVRLLPSTGTISGTFMLFGVRT